MKRTNTVLNACWSRQKSSLKKLALSALLLLGCSYAAEAQFIPDMTGKYCLDGVGTDMKSGRHGIIHGALPTTGHTGVPGTAMQFDGLSDYIELPADIWVAGDFSVAGWLYLDSYGYWERFFEFGNGIDQDNVFFSATTYSSLPTLGLHECGTSNRSYTGAPAALPLSQWVHIVVTLAGNTVVVYKDGTVWYTGTTPYPPCSIVRNLCYFGKSNYSSNSYFHGRMDDIFIFSRAIDSNEVNALYQYNQGCQYIFGRTTDIEEIQAISTVEKRGALHQNFPNPFSGNTTIKYELSTQAKVASIEITDVLGRVVKSIPLPLGTGGSVTLSKGDFVSGMYTYSMHIDGQVVDRKNMLFNAE